jgi:hypothetical protein
MFATPLPHLSPIFLPLSSPLWHWQSVSPLDDDVTGKISSEHQGRQGIARLESSILLVLAWLSVLSFHKDGQDFVQEPAASAKVRQTCFRQLIPQFLLVLWVVCLSAL